MFKTPAPSLFRWSVYCQWNESRAAAIVREGFSRTANCAASMLPPRAKTDELGKHFAPHDKSDGESGIDNSGNPSLAIDDPAAASVEMVTSTMCETTLVLSFNGGGLMRGDRMLAMLMPHDREPIEDYM